MRAKCSHTGEQSRQVPRKKAEVQEGLYKEIGEQQLGNKSGDYGKNPGWHRTPGTALVEMVSTTTRAAYGGP